MKKLFALLLALVMVLSLTACLDNKSEDDLRGDQIVNGTSSTVSQPEFSLGSTSGLTYENKFIGIGCKLDSDWTFYTDEEIRELNNVTADLAGEEFEDILKNSAVIYDMFASHSNETDNINVNLEKVNPLTLAAIDLTENYKQLMPTMKQGFENMGYKNIQMKTGTVTIDGKDFASMSTSGEIGEFKMYQTAFCLKCNGYIANITITAFDKDAVDTILDKFYLVK
ncbi:MAG: hypothetical protein E7548_04970 [Ruminococcaceae bacterium]|nr:hypothetical protein [Oscillospiraceae bacterium]